MTSESPVAPTSQRKRWIGLIGNFLAGQFLVQGLALLIGFLLLRWLSKADYAQVGLTFAFQTTLNSLIDLGFSGSIVALCGSRGRDPKVVGQYIRAARELRLKFTAFGVLATVIIFPLMTLRQGWAPGTVALLCGTIIFSIVVQTWAMYQSPLLIHGHVREYYRNQSLAAGTRFGLTALVHSIGMLSAVAASMISALALGMTGFLSWRGSRELVQEPPHAEPAYKQEMVKYLVPLMPGLIFSACQGQITVALVSIFGRTDSIAEVAALGRLSQLFLVLTAFNSVIIEPYIARVAEVNLWRRYLQITAGAAVLVLILTLIGFYVPAPLLWLLGPKYQNMGSAIGWQVFAAAVAYFATVLWVMNSARKWVAWWYTAMYIGLVLLVQVVCVLTLNLSQTLHVMYFALASSAASVAAHLVRGAVGIIESRGNAANSAQPVEEDASLAPAGSAV